jgi:hypothetical protein
MRQEFADEGRAETNAGDASSGSSNDRWFDGQPAAPFQQTL